MRAVAVKWLTENMSVQTDECVEWPYGKTNGGYGTLLLRGKRTTAHREMCRRVHGKPPAPDSQAAHSCGNRACCNPAHIRWASAAENAGDRIVDGTATRGEKGYRAKLTEQQVKQIAELLKTQTPAIIAKRLGVSRSAVKSIASGCSWAWLTGIAQPPSLRRAA